MFALSPDTIIRKTDTQNNLSNWVSATKPQSKTASSTGVNDDAVPPSTGSGQGDFDGDDNEDDCLLAAVNEFEHSFGTKTTMKSKNSAAEKDEWFPGKGVELGDLKDTGVGGSVAVPKGRFLPGIGFVPLRLPSESKMVVDGKAVSDGGLFASQNSNAVIKVKTVKNASGTLDQYLSKSDPSNSSALKSEKNVTGRLWNGGDIGMGSKLKQSKVKQKPYVITEGKLGDPTLPVGTVIRVPRFVSVSNPNFRARRAAGAISGLDRPIRSENVTTTPGVRPKMYRVLSDDDNTSAKPSKKMRHGEGSAWLKPLVKSPADVANDANSILSKMTTDGMLRSKAAAIGRPIAIADITIVHDSESDEDERKTIGSVFNKMCLRTTDSESNFSSVSIKTEPSIVHKVESSPPSMMTTSNTLRVKSEMTGDSGSIRPIPAVQSSGSVNGGELQANNDEGSSLVPCPVCGTAIMALMINEHLDSCLNF